MPPFLGFFFGVESWAAAHGLYREVHPVGGYRVARSVYSTVRSTTRKYYHFVSHVFRVS